MTLERVSFDIEGGGRVEGTLDRAGGWGELWILDERGVVVQRDYLRLDDEHEPEQR
jgi:hypothetical protein